LGGMKRNSAKTAYTGAPVARSEPSLNVRLSMQRLAPHIARGAAVLSWLACAGFGIAFVVLATIGIVRWYTPVPHADMWDGYVDSLMRISQGHYSVWWAQHNEHRIILARLLFWIDLHVFGGNAVFLLVANYVASGFSFLCLLVILKSATPDDRHNRARRTLSFVLLAMMFSWTQAENFTQGFQIQFLLAQLLPLAAFCALCIHSQSGRLAVFALSGLVGAASAGTMAAGLVVLPMLCFLSVVLRLGWRKTSALAVLSALIFYAYLRDYASVPGHGSLTETMLHHRFDLLRFTLIYLGSPLYYMSGRSGLLIPQIAGLALIAGALVFTYQVWKKPSYGLQPAPVMFMIYVGAMAFATAGGRLIFGLEAATQSRYVTPAMTAWACLLILGAPAAARRMSRRPAASMLWIVVPLALWPWQKQALQRPDDFQFESEIAALALELGVRDEKQVGLLYPSVDRALAVAGVPIERNLMIFGSPKIRDARELIGRTVQGRNRASLEPCLGALDASSAIPGDPRYVSVRGWILDRGSGRVPQVVHFVDQEGKIVGYGLSGQPRPDAAARSGFAAYVLSDALAKKLTLRGVDPDCNLPAELR